MGTRIGVWALVLLAACVQPTITKCPEVDCPKDMVCDGAGGCAMPEQLTLCAGKDSGAACSYTDINRSLVEGACSDGVCRPIGCGNLILTPNEVCDDGNTVNGDGCSADCVSNETCGNGKVDPAKGEQCDDGNLDSGDACQADCQTPRCGDGVTDTSLNEECDAGPANSRNPDAPCRTNCQVPRCGDGVVDPGNAEVCDDGNNTPGDGCAADCKSDESCGNGTVDVFANEVCDDGGTVSGDGCSSDCRSNESCGNNVKDTARGEVCDDGNLVAGDGCSSDCRSLEVCGNGVLDTIFEECDLGTSGAASNSNDPNSPCRTTCKFPACGDGILDDLLNEQCDDGVMNDDVADACRTNCQLPRCGDKIKDATEACDDGNYLSGDSCSGDCKSDETCGNGYIDTARGEQCDAGEGNSNAPNSPCRTDCKLPRCGDGAVDDTLGEACDEGAANSNLANATCRTNCQPQRCGDHILDDTDGEICDDGNLVSGDACSADCKSNESCGNGYVDTVKGETCDEGAANSNLANATCRTDCKLPRCGDGAVDDTLGEACDQGAANSNLANATCRTNCQPQRCGDTILDNTKGEVCDDGNLVSGDSCSADCKSNESCGNGYVDTVTGEKCDAGAANSNLANAACRTDCTLPRCGDGAVDTGLGEACDQGAANSNLANATCRTNCQPQRCGDAILDTTKGEVCDDGNSISGDNCSPDCKSNETCGNGIVDVVKNEQCDAGASNSNLANAPCRADCTLPRCGDGAVDTARGESCDLGAANSNLANATCRTNCQPQRCGDSILDNTKGEVCDDGNSIAGDSCSPDCKSNETCGNGIIDVVKNEQCDAGASNSNLANASCRTDCTLPRCGDGAVDTTRGEACDLGASNSNLANASCRTNCQPQRCGDTILDNTKGEVCDDGNIISGDNCSADCKSNEVCGNGIVDTAKNEKCDDGNTVNADFCHNNCTLPACGDSVVDFNEQCDAGSANSNNPNAPCRPTCTLPRCGDKIVDTALAEVCDDGNLAFADGCTPDCKSNESCGNAVVDITVGELCDDGNTRGRDGCSKCKPEDSVLLSKGQTWLQYTYEMTMTYDAGRKRVVAFTYGTTYEWDGVAWMEMRPKTSPTARYGNAMAYDPVRKRVVLFGGQYNNYLGDTWEWDGNTWVDKQPATAPSPRYWATMEFDPIRKKTVLYGGYDSTGTPFDTWEWDGTTWAQVTTGTTTNPGAKCGAKMVYDAARKQIVLHGGDINCGGTETWLFNGTTATWTLKATTAGTDTGYGPWLAYDATRSAVVLWNKAGSTWEWNGTSWSSISTAVTPVTDTRTTPPYYYGAMTYDAARGQLVGAGGYAYAYDPIYGWWNYYYNGTWLRTGTVWSEVNTFSQPIYRARAAAAYDPLRGKVVLFGGQESCSYCVAAGTSSGKNDTWEWDGRKWTQISATGSPTARAGSWADYNSSTKTTMLFGGDNYTVSVNGNTSTRTAYADLYSFNGTAWSAPASTTGRTGVRNSAMAYDAANNKIVTFGGMLPTTGSNVNDTYTWSSTTGWVIQNVASKPAVRRGHVMGYDPIRQRTVLFGGVGATGNLLGDTWEWSGSAWVQVNGTGPAGRKGSALYFNPDLGKMSLFGNNLQGNGEEDLWEYGASGWTQRLIDMPPYPNYRGATAYDAARHQLVVFGGRSYSFETGLLRYRSNVTFEACTFAALDYDNDGAAGCADSDCWSVCTPLCPPGSASTCYTTGSRCGDGTCNADLEDSDLCPSDCTFTGTIRCGDRRCSGPTETYTSCPIDCVN